MQAEKRRHQLEIQLYILLQQMGAESITLCTLYHTDKSHKPTKLKNPKENSTPLYFLEAYGVNNDNRMFTWLRKKDDPMTSNWTVANKKHNIITTIRDMSFKKALQQTF